MLYDTAKVDAMKSPCDSVWPLEMTFAGLPAPVSPTPMGREESLLEGLRGGDGDTYEALIRRYGGRMLSTARRVLGNEEDARDAVQEAFLCAFKAIRNFSGDSRLSTWLHRIVVNAALMKLRQKRRKPESSLEDLLPSFDEHGHLMEVPDRDAIPVEAIIEQREARIIVRQCIDELPESYRTILMLRDIEELDTEEVAARLGITTTAVRVRLHRARQALRTLLARRFNGRC